MVGALLTRDPGNDGPNHFVSVTVVDYDAFTNESSESRSPRRWFGL